MQFILVAHKIMVFGKIPCGPIAGVPVLFNNFLKEIFQRYLFFYSFMLYLIHCQTVNAKPFEL